jgi:4-deoxy-L-threo-5-hexosulose-uronate ketol-isomerase
MTAALPITASERHVSLDGRTSLEIRHAAHADAVKQFDTEALRRHFLVDAIFRPDEVALTYSHIDRVVIGGAMPRTHALALEALKPIGAPTFLARRELGIINVGGGAGRVSVDGATHELARLESLYVGKGANEVTFASANANDPARFYLVSAPAHAAYPTRKIGLAQTKKMHLGTRETANVRTIHQVIQPDVCPSAQLAMGFTVLEPGSVWNTMPAHRHDRRCEIYFYFDLPAEARVFHLMGAPDETRHIVVANEQAVLSPVWSMHSGVGTSAYTFVWAMAGDNQDYTDMDAIPMSELR